MVHPIKSIFCFLVVLCLWQGSKAFLIDLFNSDLLKKYSTDRLKTDGDPLILTPYLESNQIETARNLSKVSSFTKTPDVKSFSGFFTVNKKYDSNMFFWFFPSMHDPENAPVILWLSGGPGASLVVPLFTSVGPYVVDQAHNVKFQDYSWTKNFSILYFDNPVQTGYSFTGHQEGLAKNQTDVARDLMEALRQFFIMFEEFRSNDFYVGGVSYGGKYGPSIAHAIHSKGKSSGINLKGLIMESGYCDPVNMINYADLLYQIGLIDRKSAAYFKTQQNLMIRLIQNEKYYDSFVVLKKLLLDVGGEEPSYFIKVTGLPNYYNYQNPNFLENATFSEFVLSPEFRNAVHVGNLSFNSAAKVSEALQSDFMWSVKPWTETIMNNYKVLIYSGQADVIVNYVLTESFLENANWTGAKDFVSVDRIVWKVDPKDTEIAGYVRQVGNLTEAMVRNAGHIVGYDKPREVFDLLARFVYKKSF